MQHLWPVIVTDLIISLQESGEQFFSALLDVTPQEFRNTNSRDIYDGQALEATRVMQYQAVQMYITKNNLMGKKDIDLFARLFTSKFFYNQESAAQRMSGYLQQDFTTRIFLFSGDVAKHITGDQHPIEMAMKYSPAWYVLFEHAQQDAARVFALYGVKPRSLLKRLFG